MNTKVQKKFFDKATSNPAFVLAVGFLLLITVGGVLLSTPFVTRSGHATNPLDAFFVAISASCVTGLTPVNTVEHWNNLGHVIIIILIQIGGLGIMTLASLVPLILGKKIGIKSRTVLKEQLNIESMSGMINLFKYVLIFTLTVEFLGAALLSIRFIPSYGIGKGIWYSVFHSISAFCNAGFDILGDSIYPLRDDALVNITLMALVVIGGLGFMVTSEIFYKKNFQKLTTHAKLVIYINIILIVGGALAFYLLEVYTDGVLRGETMKGRIIESFFQSVSARTAGFYSVDLSQINDSTAFMLLGLMFIGGSPGSTAGGIKTTTFGILFLATFAEMTKRKEVVVYKRRIGDESVRKALSIFLTSLTVVMIVSFVISLTDDFAIIDILYETVSALATVGASRGITGLLSPAGKVMIGLCMYLGRIGPMTMAFAFGIRSNEKLIRYPEAPISLG